MSDLVEQVARAICRKNTDEYISNDPDFIIVGRARADGKPIVTWKLFEPQARAAIEVVLTPQRLAAAFGMVGHGARLATWPDGEILLNDQFNLNRVVEAMKAGP
jgi:hypothetical protein